MNKVKAVISSITSKIKQLLPKGKPQVNMNISPLKDKKAAKGEATLASSPPIASQEIDRPMKFPYTYSAKFAQFPYRFLIDNNWMYKYYIYGFICCIPIFYKLQRMSKSKGNKEKWAEIKRQEALEFEHHLDHD